jgi:hypothetical protein
MSPADVARILGDPSQVTELVVGRIETYDAQRVDVFYRLSSRPGQSHEISGVADLSNRVPRTETGKPIPLLVLFKGRPVTDQDVLQGTWRIVWYENADQDWYQNLAFVQDSRNGYWEFAGDQAQLNAFGSSSDPAHRFAWKWNQIQEEKQITLSGSAPDGSDTFSGTYDLKASGSYLRLGLHAGTNGPSDQKPGQVWILRREEPDEHLGRRIQAGFDAAKEFIRHPFQESRAE